MIIKNFEPGQGMEAETFVKEFIQYCGELIAVYHLRNMDEDEYETVIVGRTKILSIRGGLSSGFEGEGAESLINVLVYLGVSPSDARNQVLGNSDPVAHIKYYFNEV